MEEGFKVQVVWFHHKKKRIGQLSLMDLLILTTSSMAHNNLPKIDKEKFLEEVKNASIEMLIKSGY